TAGAGTACARGHLPADRGRTRPADRPGARDLVSGAPFLHRRRRARTARPRRPGGAAIAARTLSGGGAVHRRTRPTIVASLAPCPARRIHGTGVPERQARSGTGRGGGRPD